MMASSIKTLTVLAFALLVDLASGCASAAALDASCCSIIESTPMSASGTPTGQKSTLVLNSARTNYEANGWAVYKDATSSSWEFKQCSSDLKAVLPSSSGATCPTDLSQSAWTHSGNWGQSKPAAGSYYSFKCTGSSASTASSSGSSASTASSSGSSASTASSSGCVSDPTVLNAACCSIIESTESGTGLKSMMVLNAARTAYEVNGWSVLKDAAGTWGFIQCSSMALALHPSSSGATCPSDLSQTAWTFSGNWGSSQPAAGTYYTFKCAGSSSSGTSSSSSSMGAIVGAGVGGVVLLGAVAVGVVVYLKKKSDLSKPAEPSSTSTV